ncbi:hypothetical protein HMPREF1247_0704 [Atopobium sp. BV3Ac4]|nr:hypothetical protein HMPREF1247_0704 [Atopobium sp. BV3Ac4]
MQCGTAQRTPIQAVCPAPDPANPANQATKKATADAMA